VFCKPFVMILILIFAALNQSQAQSPDTISTRWNGDYLLYLHDGTLSIMDTSGKVLPLPEDMPADIRDAAWSPDGKRFAVGTDSGEVIIWKISNTNNRYTFEEAPITLNYGTYTDNEGVPRGVHYVRWSPTGEYIAASGIMGEITLQVWETQTYNSILKVAAGITPFITWKPTEAAVLTIVSNKEVRLLDIGSFSDSDKTDLNYQEWLSLTSPIGRNVTDQLLGPAAWSPDGEKLAVADWLDGSLWIITVDTDTATLFVKLHQPNVILYPYSATSLVWSKTGKHLLGAVRNGDTGTTRVDMWDTATGATLQTYTSSAAYLGAIDLDPQGERLVFGDVPQNARSDNLIEAGAVHIVNLTD
jgi:WD40 repeat protein